MCVVCAETNTNCQFSINDLLKCIFRLHINLRNAGFCKIHPKMFLQITKRRVCHKIHGFTVGIES